MTPGEQLKDFMRTMMILLTVILAAIVGAQTPGSTFYNQPFLWETSRLPANFTGHDVRGICAVLLDRTKPKGEFETTAAYEQRIKEAGNAPIDTLKLGTDLLALELEGTSFDYVADNGSFNVTQSVGVQGSSLALPLNYGGLTTQGSYTATNALGAVVRVSKGEFYSYQIAVMNDGALSAYASEMDRKASLRFGTPMRISFRFPLPWEKARDTKPNLKLFAVAKLNTPFINTKTTNQTATFANPTEGVFYTYTLMGELHSLLVVNVRTGEILHKMKTQKN